MDRLKFVAGIESSSFLARLVKSCRDSKDLVRGKRVHEQILSSSENSQNIYLLNLLVDMFARCGSIEDARMVFEGINQPNMYSWNIMLAAYAQNGHLEEVRRTFDGMPHKSLVAWNTIIAAYAQAEQLDEVKGMFDRMPQRNVVSWNTLLTAYAHKGYLDDASTTFDRMPQRDSVSWNAMISGHAQAGHVEEAKATFQSMPQPETASWNIMIHVYAQNGHMEDATSMFEAMPERDMVSWNAMVAGNALNGHLGRAKRTFDCIPRQNVVSWNAMIAAYAQNGLCKYGIELVRDMNLEGVKPDVITFMSMLSGCGHMGMIDQGRQYFLSMITDYGLKPQVEHYCCMIDILGRAKRLNAAEELMNNMPFLPDAVVWTTLLGACRLHGDVELGNRVAKQILELDPEVAAPYVLLSNTYATTDSQVALSQDSKHDIESRCSMYTSSRSLGYKNAGHTSWQKQPGSS